MKDTDDMESIIAQFRTGNFILLHDDESRENEVDMILAGNFATPSNIQIMRELGGGLLCVAIPNEIGLILDLPYMWQLLDSANDSYSSLSNIINTDGSGEATPAPPVPVFETILLGIPGTDSESCHSQLNKSHKSRHILVKRSRILVKFVILP